MSGALEAMDDILRRVASGHPAAGEAVYAVLRAQFRLRNQRRLQTTMRSARLPVVRTVGDFDVTFRARGKRGQLGSLHTLVFLERKGKVALLGSAGFGKPRGAIMLAIAAADSALRIYHVTMADLLQTLSGAAEAGHRTRRLRKLVFRILIGSGEIGYHPTPNVEPSSPFSAQVAFTPS
jgi:DNA replication protein DnaC